MNDAASHLATAEDTAAATPFFRITVIDEQTGRGIPLVKLALTNQAEYWTDSAGVVAFLEPEMMGARVMFVLESFGYSIERDLYGRQTVQLVPTPGGSAVIKMRREMIAQRIYRVTGSDIYRDSQILGDTTPPTQDPSPLPVTGIDSVLTAVYQGRMFWVWGDTGISGTNLGNFKATAALSDLPGRGGLDPDKGVYLKFFRRDDGWVQSIFHTDHQGMVWLGGLHVVRDNQGKECLYANYTKLVPPMRSVESGLCRFNDEIQQFEGVWVYPPEPPIRIGGSMFPHADGDTEYFYHVYHLPVIRSRADAESTEDISSYEAFTCLREGERLSSPGDPLDRDPEGRLRWAWRKDTSVINPHDMEALAAKGLVALEEGPCALRDAETGDRIAPHGGSVAWNEYRKRWVLTLLQSKGASFMGEVWYFEGDTPLGPWVFGQKVVTHAISRNPKDEGRRVDETKPEDRITYSFYGVRQHADFAKEGGRVIYLEGTYTMWLSTSKCPTPRYNYNQMMYKVEVDDPRLALPVPVYRVAGEHAGYYTKADLPEVRMDRDAEVAFYAPDRSRKGTVPVYRVKDAGGIVCLSLERSGEAEVAFFAVAAGAETPGATVSLYEYVNAKTEERLYVADPAAKDEPVAETDEAKQAAEARKRILERYAQDLSGFEKSARPLCRVWPNPMVFNPYREA